MIEQHIGTCDECSLELKGLDRMITRLKTLKAAFCPEPWEVYEFVERGVDPDGEIASHLAECRLCAEEAASYRARSVEAALPQKVQAAFEEHFRKSAFASHEVERRGPLAAFMEWLSSAFRVPAMAVAVAAAILVAVMIYPRGEIQPMIGLSSVTWGQTESGFIPKSGLFEEQKPRAAILLAFKGFKEPLPQQKIDSLYEALRPTEEIKKKFDVLTPAEVKDAITESKIKPDSTKAMQEVLHTDLDVSRLLVVTVTPKGDGFTIESEVRDARTGGSVVKKSEQAATSAELPSRLTNSILLLLAAKATDR